MKFIISLHLVQTEKLLQGEELTSEVESQMEGMRFDGWDIEDVTVKKQGERAVGASIYDNLKHLRELAETPDARLSLDGHDPTAPTNFEKLKNAIDFLMLENKPRTQAPRKKV